MNQNSYLQAVSYYFPKRFNTNADLSDEHPEWSVEKIASKTGIEKRYLADESETSGDLGVEAAQHLFEEYNIPRDSIDYIIFCTQSPDYFLPTTACIIQDRLGLQKSCGAFDFNLGCSGFVYGLGIAKGFLLSDQAKSVLLITAETYTKRIHPKDKGNKTIFGDGASASLVTNQYLKGYLNAQILDFSFYTDGSGYDKLMLKNGGFRAGPFKKAEDIYAEGTFIRNDDYIYMDGKSIFDFTAFKVPPSIDDNLKKNNLSVDEIDLFIFHQANAFMMNFVRQRCKIPENKFFVDLADGGNTVSSTIPIALKRAIEKGFDYKNKRVLLSGFGVGLSIGSVVLTFKIDD
jgi:3-oxoacyl-[acyl-carrier-protein] synthase-3